MKSATGVAARKVGVKTKLFGVVLIFVGMMDAMLAWRGGLALDGFYVFLIAAAPGPHPARIDPPGAAFGVRRDAT